MRIYLLLLIIAALLQSSFLPLNLVLMLLIARSFVIEDELNYFFALGLGIFLGIMSVENIGVWPVIFILAVKLTYIFKRLPLTSNFITLLPISLVILTLTDLGHTFFLNQNVSLNNFEFIKLVIEIALMVPIYAIVYFLEDRIVSKPALKLKVR